MPILHHEFVYACFHPTMDDCLIALERNYYPNDSELYQLVKEEGSFYVKLIKHLEGLRDIQKLKKISQLLGIDKKVITVVTDLDDSFNMNEDNNINNIMGSSQKNNIKLQEAFGPQELNKTNSNQLQDNNKQHQSGKHSGNNRLLNLLGNKLKSQSPGKNQQVQQNQLRIIQENLYQTNNNFGDAAAQHQQISVQPIVNHTDIRPIVPTENEYESSRSLISSSDVQDDTQGNGERKKDYSFQETSIADMDDNQLDLNKEAIADAIRKELLNRINANVNKAQTGLRIGGKDLGQVVGSTLFKKQNPLFQNIANTQNPLTIQTNLPNINNNNNILTPSSQQSVQLTLSGNQLEPSSIKDKQFQRISNLDGKRKTSQFHAQVYKIYSQTFNVGLFISFTITNLYTDAEEAFEEFQFEEPLSLREEKMEGASKKKYGISIWKLNRGQQAYQINEHPFNQSPALSKFFISHDAKHIIVLLTNENDDQNKINCIRFLDIKTLKVVNELKSPTIQSFSAKSIIDINILWDSQYLYVQTADYGYFLNVQGQRFDQIYDLTQQSTSSYKIAKHPIFKESDFMIMYNVVYQSKKIGQGDLEVYSFYQTYIQKSDDIFEQKNFMMPITQGGGLEYDGVIGYDKLLTRIVFPGEQVYYIYYFKSQKLQPFRNVQNCQLQKNCFLYETIWLAYNDDNYDTFAIPTDRTQNKYSLSKLDLDDFRLGDIMKERYSVEQEQSIISIGKKGEKEASSRICINVSKQDGQQPYINYMQETSDYEFTYPFIMFCKGNTELFIQNMNQPDRLIKLDLEDQFLCFADINHHVKLKPLHVAFGLQEENQQFRSFESVAFLTQKHDKIHINILEYAPYSFEKQYTLFRSQQNIIKPKNIFKFPMIYCPSKYKESPDMCFYISKDGYSTKVERLGFNGKEHKDPISTAFELKTQNIFVFCKHEKFFYIMDDTLSLKKFEYDKRTQKLKLIKIFEFSSEYKDILAQTLDFDDIQVTERGVYRGLLFIPFFETNMFNKDINLIKTDPIFNIADNELFAGPKKLEGTQNLLFIARGDKQILKGDIMSATMDDIRLGDSFEDQVSEQDEVSIALENHNVPKYSPSKTKSDRDSDLQISLIKPTTYKQIKKINSQLSRSRTQHRHVTSTLEQQNVQTNRLQIENNTINHKPTLSIVSSQTNDKFDLEKTMNFTRKSLDDDLVSKLTQSKTMKDRSSSKTVMKSQKTQRNQKDFNNEQVYAWIVPYLDSNVIHFTHNIKENSNPKYQVTFSTFINNNDEILCEINKIFYVFSKNGSFLYQVNSVRDNNKKNAFYFQQKSLVLENVSTNLTYYLFHDAKQQHFEIYQLVRDKLEEDELRKTISKFKFTRLMSKKLKSTRKTNSFQVYDQYVQPYIFKFIKTVKEYSELRIKEDYFNQRTISNRGDVYQMVQYKKNHFKSALKKKITFKFSNLFKQNEEEKQKSQIQDEVSYLNEAQCVFNFYIDDKEITNDLKGKFKLIQDHLEGNRDPLEEFRIFGYQILGEYLYIKRERQIEYLKIFHTDPVKKTKSYIINNQYKTKFVHLILDQETKIQRIIATANKFPRLVQLIVSDDRFLYVITWDIDKNIEHQMMQIEQSFDFNAGHAVCKGITERHNYIPIDNCFYDLYFGLPFKFFQNINIKLPKKAKMNLNERKFSQFNKEYLDLYENNKILKSYTYLDLCYLKAFQNLNKDQIEQQHIMMRHLNVRIHGQTFFSFIAMDFNLLKQMFLEIQKIDEQGGQLLNQDKFVAQQAKILYLHILYPNYTNMSAFDIAMEKKSPKSIEIMFDMLCELEHFSLSKFFMHHFSELFQMELLSFQNFLASCLFQLPRMKDIRMLKWIHDEDEYYTDYHTSYLGDTFYKKIEKVNLNFMNRDHHSEFEQKGKEKTINTEYTNTFQNLDDNSKIEGQFRDQESDDNKYGILGRQDNMMMRNQGIIENMQWKKEYEYGELKRVETFAVEFDWIFRGKNAISFIGHLAHSANDSIFAVETIKIIVLFMWHRFFYNIRNKIFIPFLTYFILLMVQVAFIYQRIVYIEAVREGRADTDEQFTQEDYEKWLYIDYGVVTVILVLWTYFFLIELKQIIAFKHEYLKDFWNYLDIGSLSLNLAYLIRDLADAEVYESRIISGLAVLVMWIKLLYFLRLFAPTAALIRLLAEIIQDMFVFTIIFFITIIGFADTFYILAYNLTNDESNGMFQDNFFLSFIYSYRNGLGDFQLDAIRDSGKVEGLQVLWYILFLVQTVFIQIIMLNLLVSIMGDTFERVSSKKEESKLKEICEMISDYEGIVNRDKEFQHSKYIIVVKVEKAQANNSSDWEGRLSSLKSFFQGVVSEVRKESKIANDNLREEVIGNAKAMEQKFMDLQQIIMRQTSQISLALKKMDKVGDDVIKLQNYKKGQYYGSQTQKPIITGQKHIHIENLEPSQDILNQNDCDLQDDHNEHTPQITMQNIGEQIIKFA